MQVLGFTLYIQSLRMGIYFIGEYNTTWCFLKLNQRLSFLKTDNLLFLINFCFPCPGNTVFTVKRHTNWAQKSNRIFYIRGV